MIIKGIAIIPENHPVRIVNAILERMDRDVVSDKHLEILGERNSYSKTDPDATFMHMKEDAMTTTCSTRR